MERFNSYGEHLQRSQVDVVEQVKRQFEDKLRMYGEREQERERQEERLREDIEEERRSM